MDAASLVSLSIDALILIIIGTGIRMHFGKFKKMEEQVADTISKDKVELLIDKRIDEKNILLDYRLRELTKAVDKLTSKLDSQP